MTGTATTGRSSTKGVYGDCDWRRFHSRKSQVQRRPGSITMASLVGSALAAGAMTDSTRTGCVASGAGAGGTTLVSGSETLADSADAGWPQFVQKPVPGSSLLPHDVQKRFVEAVGEAVSTSSGAVAATGAASASSRFPHSVQKREPGSPGAPHEEQTGTRYRNRGGWVCCGRHRFAARCTETCRILYLIAARRTKRHSLCSRNSHCVTS